MPISLSCPGCASRMKAPDSAGGKKLKCPKCTYLIEIPDIVEGEPVEEATLPVATPLQPMEIPAGKPPPDTRASALYSQSTAHGDGARILAFLLIFCGILGILCFWVMDPSSETLSFGYGASGKVVNIKSLTDRSNGIFLSAFSVLIGTLVGLLHK